MDYWAKVKSAAWDEAVDWLHSRPELAMLGVVMTVIGIIAVWTVGGSRDAAVEETILRIAGTLVILAAFPVVYWRTFFAIPPRWHEDLTKTGEAKNSEIAALREAATPRLVFEIAKDGRWFFQQGGKADCYIAVRNTSTTRTIDDVKVFMEWHSMGKDTKTQTNEVALLLQFREGSATDIPPTGKADFRLCTIFDEPWPEPAKHTFVGRIAFAPQADATRSPQNALGTYEVHLRAEGRDMQPVPAVCILLAHPTTTDLRLDPTKIGADWPSL